MSKRSRKRKINREVMRIMSEMEDKDETVTKEKKKNESAIASPLLSTSDTGNDFPTPSEELPLSPSKVDDVDPETYLPETTQPETHVNYGKGQQENLPEFLTNWAIVYKVPHVAVSSLLKGLKEMIEPSLPNVVLPKDYRTLLKTPRAGTKSEIPILPCGGGHYAHIGVKSGINRAVLAGVQLPDDGRIQLSTFCDGFNPLNTQLTKFIATTHSLWNTNSRFVFASGLYSGRKKPKPYDDILVELVDEILDLSTNTFQVPALPGKDLLIITGGPWLFDLPGRADCMCVKSGGYASCGKCTQFGENASGSASIVFPQLSSFTLRTDISFREKWQKRHHIADTQLARLDVDLVEDVPLEPMHLIYLGAFKRLLNILFNWTSHHRLRKSAMAAAAQWFIYLQKFMPCEFQWRTNDFMKVDSYKAKEYRYVLLYTAIVVFKFILPSEVYKHFLEFSIAIRILSDEHIATDEEWQTVAEQLIYAFVYFFKTTYGPDHMVRVVHGLLHVTNDVRRFGPLDSFSAFRYEHFQGVLGRFINSPTNLLQQVVYRYVESLQVERQKRTGFVSGAVLLGPIVAPLFKFARNEVHHSYVEVDGFRLTTSLPNNTILLDSGDIFVLAEIFKRNDTVFIKGKKFNRTEDFFQEPIPSRRIGIYLANGLSLTIQEYPLAALSRKCINFHLDEGCLIVPLLHCS